MEIFLENKQGYTNVYVQNNVLRSIFIKDPWLIDLYLDFIASLK